MQVFWHNFGYSTFDRKRGGVILGLGSGQIRFHFWEGGFKIDGRKGFGGGGLHHTLLVKSWNIFGFQFFFFFRLCKICVWLPYEFTVVQQNQQIIALVKPRWSPRFAYKRVCAFGWRWDGEKDQKWKSRLRVQGDSANSRPAGRPASQPPIILTKLDKSRENLRMWWEVCLCHAILIPVPIPISFHSRSQNVLWKAALLPFFNSWEGVIIRYNATPNGPLMYIKKWLTTCIYGAPL